ncbi:MAG TPA: hypothetical protein VLF65_11120, partial [Burkholderiales bacterium]|nr:hypothetical protein [Burkholderiales bacterium]
PLASMRVYRFMLMTGVKLRQRDGNATDECRAFATMMRTVERKLHPTAGFSGSEALGFLLIFPLAEI